MNSQRDINFCPLLNFYLISFFLDRVRGEVSAARSETISTEQRGLATERIRNFSELPIANENDQSYSVAIRLP